MKTRTVFLSTALALATTTAGLSQGRLPQYCKTDAGVLGPYRNPGNVGVGDPCFGTRNGTRYEGVAVMSPSDSGGGSSDKGGGGESRKGDGGLPRYCKTDAGVLGPYRNPGNVAVGDPCFGTKNGTRYEGVAVMSPSDGGGGSSDNGGGESRKGNGGLPRYCKTDAGVLGPYQNPGNVAVGDPCFGTKNGTRYEGVAVMGPGS
jgi:hypothetical protein